MINHHPHTRRHHITSEIVITMVPNIPLGLPELLSRHASLQFNRGATKGTWEIHACLLLLPKNARETINTDNQVPTAASDAKKESESACTIRKMNPAKGVQNEGSQTAEKSYRRPGNWQPCVNYKTADIYPEIRMIFPRGPPRQTIIPCVPRLPIYLYCRPWD
jgi:hypothetical protein